MHVLARVPVKRGYGGSLATEQGREEKQRYSKVRRRRGGEVNVGAR